MRDYRKYDVWKKSHKLALEVYEVTKDFPKSEMYGITSQLRRASLSVPTNIVEGAGRKSDTEFARFLIIASGSAAEVEYLLEFSVEIKYIPVDTHLELSRKIVEVRKMIYALHQTMNNTNRKKDWRR